MLGVGLAVAEVATSHGFPRDRLSVIPFTLALYKFLSEQQSTFCKAQWTPWDISEGNM